MGIFIHDIYNYKTKVDIYDCMMYICTISNQGGHQDQGGAWETSDATWSVWQKIQYYLIAFNKIQ